MKKIFFAALLAISMSIVPAAADEADPLDQTVVSSEQVSAEHAEVNVGHIDLGPKVVDGEWKLLARDDNSTPAVWRDPNNLVMRVSNAAKMEVPEGQEYEFLQLDKNREAYVVPQTQIASVIWLGWNTQDPAVVEQLDRGGKLQLRSVSGPGNVSVFLQNGFDGITQLWNSSELPQEFWVDANTHTHANWVFTKPGNYRLDVAFNAKLKDGSEIEVPASLTFAVGDEASGEVDSSQTVAPKNQESLTQEQSEGNPVTLWLIISACAVVVVVATAFVAAKARRAKNAA